MGIDLKTEFFSDPRLTLLMNLHQKHVAIGSVICFWEVGQVYWRKNKSFIPEHIFKMIPLSSDLLAVGFAVSSPEGVYCCGAKEKWDFLSDPVGRGRAGGIASASSRVAKYGSSDPVQVRIKHEANTKQDEAGVHVVHEQDEQNGFVREQTRTNDVVREQDEQNGFVREQNGFVREQTRTNDVVREQDGFVREQTRTNDVVREQDEASYSSSSSSSSSSSYSLSLSLKNKSKSTGVDSDEKGSVVRSGETWDAYSKAYASRYGAPPVRNASVNAKLAQLVKRLGAEEAPRVAKFFLSHNDAFYVKTMHETGVLLKDAEKLRTEWATGNKMVGSKAREIERMQYSASNWDQAAEILNDRRKAQ